MINIDFSILNNYDPHNLYVMDASDWDIIENKPSIVEITLPGEIIPVTHEFHKQRVNIFNAHNLGLSCDNCSDSYTTLPDGIYKIRVKGSPDTYQCNKDFLKSDNTRLELDRYVTTKLTKCECPTKEVIDKVNDINFLLDAADSAARMGSFCDSQEFLFKAQKKIGKLSGCKTCV